MIGGFIIAVAIRKSGLAARLTFNMLSRFGTTPDRRSSICNAASHHQGNHTLNGCRKSGTRSK
jgi:hypothetical protein